jgi:hypothetical protein
MHNLKELTSVFWDGVLEGTLDPNNYNEWIDQTGIKATLLERWLCITKHYEKKCWYYNSYHDMQINKHKNHSMQFLKSHCTTINGNLEIRDSFLDDLDNLCSLREINGSLIIRNNDYLENINGLGNLKKICGDLKIDKNILLQNLDGLENLETLRGDISIYNCRNLNNINSLLNIKHPGCNKQTMIGIYNNPELSLVDCYEITQKLHKLNPLVVDDYILETREFNEQYPDLQRLGKKGESQ